MQRAINLLSSLLEASYFPHFRSRLSVAAATAILLLFAAPSTAFAGSATWKTNPGTGNWNNANNWMPSTVPNGTSDIATFISSNKVNVTLSATTEVNGIVFDAGASAFTISVNPSFQLKVSGVGITNNSAINQNFVTAVNGSSNGAISFFNSATAGSGTVFTNHGGTVSNQAGGFVFFSGDASAENGTFINNSRVAQDAFGGAVSFSGNSTAANGTFINQGNGRPIDPNVASSADIRFSTAATAGNATFTNNGGAINGAIGGTVLFMDNANAGHATLINNGGSVSGAGGGSIVFSNQSNAANATLIANGGVDGGAGGTIQFRAGSRGGKARVAVHGNGSLDISVPMFQEANPKTIGSIEGNGAVYLGANNLFVGSNNLSTVFSGTIQQEGGAYGGAGGSLTKIGSGKLVLQDGNTYIGINVNGGKLVINNTHASYVQVNSGRLGGKGTIAGVVFIGNGGFPGILSPGDSALTTGTLTIQSELFFNSTGTYNCWINTKRATADKVIANGVTINSGAQFSFADVGSSALTPGTVFTVIDNTAATPIAGTFSNLAHGATFTDNGNTYRVNYQGGTGNDLTLTVVP